jgi:UDP-N-acetylmuramoyl-L-alanyl-D-glutamate--2,6-diaminopimelate ligase
MSMALAELFQSISHIRGGLLMSAPVLALADDSRKVVPGSLFFAVPGSQKDGAQFALRALEKGALAVVAHTEPEVGFEDRWIQVPDVRKARLEIANKFYSNPFATLMVHGVTGTSGKTTTAFLMEAVLVAMGEKVALLGTVCSRIGTRVVSSELTTPGVLELHAFAAEAVASGCKHLVMEVSSHALDQARVGGMLFDSCLFSNLSRDHLDYHRDMEEYFQAKSKLFTQYRRGVSVVNVDDSYGERLAVELLALGVSVTRVSRLGKPADLVPKSVLIGEDGLELWIPALSDSALKANLFGDFNADNVLLLCGWVFALRYPVKALREALLTVQVPGRFELAYSDGVRRVIVDYAHKPDALERVLASARAICRRKLVVVFGCGGDRDRGKRPMMGRIAETHADMCFVTSDNPRTEDPDQIIKEILAGMQKNNHAVVVDRRLAIQVACRALEAGDWLIVAGKGHEDYQIIGTTKYPFDDRGVVREAFGC